MQSRPSRAVFGLACACPFARPSEARGPRAVGPKVEPRRPFRGAPNPETTTLSDGIEFDVCPE